jgi:hypothetical protein
LNRLPDVEPVLRAYLADTSDRAPDRVLADVAARIADQPQRRTWRLRGRPLMNGYAKLAAGLAAVIAVAFVGYNVLPGVGNFGGQPSPSPASTPSPSPRATGSLFGPAAAPLPDEGALVEGAYIFEVEGSSLSLSALVPGGWRADTGDLMGPNGWQEPGGVTVGFTTVDGLYQDPCHWSKFGNGGGPVVVPVGPKAIDLVDAIKASSNFVITERPQGVSLGSHTGYTMQIKLPDGIDLMECDLGDFGILHHYRGFAGSGETSLKYAPDRLALRTDLLIVDYHGTRLIAYIRHYDGTPDADLEAARAILESVEVLP